MKRAVFAAAAAVCILLPLDLLLNGLNTAMHCREFLLIAAAAYILCLFLPGKQGIKRAVYGLLGVEVLVGLLVLALWKNFSTGAVYEEAESTPKELFAGKKVMILAPHEDDDINLCGGIISQYTAAGSKVYMVFSTNGDYTGLGERRIDEAIACMKLCSVPEEQVIFLGYGDQWREGESHLYNAKEGEVRTSYAGHRETYGTADHPAFRNGKAYTAEGFIEDLRDVITEYMPDVIYCVERETHGDHAALSLGFEKAVGEVLKEHNSYHPQVLKGFAYDTAFFAERDYYAENMQSTLRPESEIFQWEDSIYHWEKRQRMPVKASLLSRSLYSSGIYKELEEYASQNAKAYAESVINGDRVFWQRRTDSLLYDAEITASSGNPNVLNDFMLVDDEDIIGGLDTGTAGVWHPDETDQERTIHVVFPEERNITEIWLYDHPDGEENILNARIVFDDGEKYETGPLQKHGAATKIKIDRQKVKSFQIILEKSEGTDAGLTEIEAFGQEKENKISYIKIMDADNNFAYDYMMDERAVFQIYCSGEAAENAEYCILCSNEICSAVIREGNIEVTLPEGENCVLTVEDKNGEYSDSIILRSRKGEVKCWQYAEEHFPKMFMCQIPKIIRTEVIPALIH